jgi:hypothetical protein
LDSQIIMSSLSHRLKQMKEEVFQPLQPLVGVLTPRSQQEEERLRCIRKYMMVQMKANEANEAIDSK